MCPLDSTFVCVGGKLQPELVNVLPSGGMCGGVGRTFSGCPGPVMRGWGAYFMGGDNRKQWNERGLAERVSIRDKVFRDCDLGQAASCL